MRYKVTVLEHVCYEVSVEAGSESEARVKAGLTYDLAGKGETTLVEATDVEEEGDVVQPE